MQLGKDILRESGIYMLFDDIDDASSKDLIRFILEHNLRGEVDQLSIIINSEGGYAESAFSITDAFNWSKIPIQTIGTGMVASSALFVFMAGDERILRPNTCILSHEASSSFEGKDHEAVATMIQNTNLRKMIFSHYKRYSGLSKKIIEAELLPPSDVWLTPKEAVKYGLADRVVNLVNKNPVKKKAKKKK
jgi:ATP-dependent Clp protease protease subunit